MPHLSSPEDPNSLAAGPDHSRQREAALREILDLISQSREDAAPVFDALVHRAADLCGAEAALLVIGKAGDRSQQLASQFGIAQLSVDLYARGEVSMDPDVSIAARAILTGMTIHVPDMMETEGYRNGVGHYVSAVRDTGVRSQLFVPLMSSNGGIGCILVNRKAFRPFSHDEIALVETFAAQAVIAIDNARQFSELHLRLAREAATREILEVISQSRDDAAPVFDVVLRKAAELCGASMASLIQVSEDRSHAVAVAEWGEHVPDQRPVGVTAWPMESMHAPSTCLREGRIVHIPDLADTDLYRSGDPIRVTAADVEGIRTFLSVPMFIAGKTVSCLSIYRREVRPFTAGEIALVETFAAQSVIAIENVRQFRELQARLEREAATRDILEVISQSRDDDAPVFDAILRSAARLCNSPMAWLLLADDARTTMTLAGYHGDSRRSIQIGDKWPLDPDPDPQTGFGGVQDDSVLRAIFEARTIQDDDMALTPHYLAGDASMRQLVDEEGLRTRLSVPLVRSGKGIGIIVLSRREVAPFGPEDVALLDTFAEQAVIAIENVRQFRKIQTANAELETRLAREAATREILEVISQSRDDERPVFDAVLRNSAILCGASRASLDIISEDRGHAVLVAHWGENTVGLLPVGTTVWNLDAVHAPSTSMREGRIVHVHDMADTDLYRSGDPKRVAAVEMEGIRTFLAVPLVSGGKSIGCIEVYRREVRPFTPDEIALLETFAAQAAIAIENVRQFRELQTRLAREAATREILEVISQSRDDDKPVFDVVLRKAADLCNAPSASLLIISEDRSQAVLVADWGHDQVPGLIQVGTTVWAMESDYAPSVSMREGRIAHIHDMADTDLYRSGDPLRVAAVEEDGIRTFLAVPLFSGGQTVGCILVYRREVQPFTPDEIALVETFAAQAVIAIENVRQFRELQARLEREAATRDILEVISQSRDDDMPVFEMIAQSAARLCRSANCTFWRVENGLIKYCASSGFDPADFEDVILTPMDVNTPLADNTLIGQVVKTRSVARIMDGTAESYLDHEWARAQGLKQMVGVPIFVGNEVWGSINLMWPTDQAPRDEDIHLVESFAAQAAIAIENVRQFRAVQTANAELETRLSREAATREILEFISHSRDDDRPVFDAILHRAAALCGASAAALVLGRAGDAHQVLAAHYGVSPNTVDIYAQGKVTMDPAVSIAADAILRGSYIHIEDMAETEGYRLGLPQYVSVVRDTGVRTELYVPLIAAEGGIGCLIVFRTEVRPFTEQEIALVQSFAAQAVIAVEDVRQFRELQNRLAREAATREILEVISQSRDDDQPVFDAMLRNANRLCGTSMAYLVLGRPDDTHMTMAAYVNPHLPSQDAVDQIIAFANQSAMRMNAAEHFSARAILSGEVVQIADIAATPGYLSGEPTTRILVEDVGVRTILSVPLFDAQGTIGAISLQRREERPFSDDEIALIQGFAAQAVIAIENVRQFRELQTRLAREAATRNILRVISESPDDEQPTFEAILDSATRLCGTEYASIVLGRKGDEAQRMVAHRGDTEETLSLFRAGKVPMDPEDSFAARAILEGRSIQVPDMAETDHYRDGHERFRMVVDRLGLRTNLFVPLLGPEGGIGCLMLWKKEVAPFTADQIALMETFASHAVIAIENVRQFRALEALNAELGDRVQEQVGEIERMGRLKRFLPSAVADAVVSSGSERMLKSHRALLGVLFCDIRGFTAFCETAEPEETIEVLQTYHDEMGRLIEAHGAGVDHRMGDGIMVLFNDPLPCDDPAGSAVQLAIAMRARMAELCAKWKKMGYRLGFGVGISLGYATVGMVGSGGRQDYTASGTAINMASRLADEAQDGEILLSPRARTAVEDDFATESRGEITLKGIREPVEVFCVTGVAG